MLELSGREVLLRTLRSPFLGQRSSRLHLTDLDYACAETDIGEILLRMIEGHTESGHRSSRLHDWTGRWKRWRDRLDIIGTLL